MFTALLLMQFFDLSCNDLRQPAVNMLERLLKRTAFLAYPGRSCFWQLPVLSDSL